MGVVGLQGLNRPSFPPWGTGGGFFIKKPNGGIMPNLTADEVKEIIGDREIKTFVETGTRYGRTLNNVSHLFKRCHTIEINEYFYTRTKDGLHHERFPNISDRENITFHLGDSAKILPKLLAELNEPLFIFLDAHFMSKSPNPTRGEVDVPLYEEIDAIIRHPFPDIIVVDDVHICGMTAEQKRSGGADWTKISIERMVQQLKPKKHWVRSVSYESGVAGVKEGEVLDCHLVMEK
jgi:hypothetical protein